MVVFPFPQSRDAVRSEQPVEIGFPATVVHPHQPRLAGHRGDGIEDHGLGVIVDPGPQMGPTLVGELLGSGQAVQVRHRIPGVEAGANRIGRLACARDLLLLFFFFLQFFSSLFCVPALSRRCLATRLVRCPRGFSVALIFIVITDSYN